jgi:uncharacterized Zn finger protein
VSDWWRFRDFGPSLPRKVKGGIKARSARGAKFGESWWAQRWIQVLESFGLGARLGRGRRYARSGQVTALHTDAGCVTAKVQGSRPKPYDVIIRIKTLSPEQWVRVGDALNANASFRARLLAGEMPPEIEQSFCDAGASLFPERGADLRTECSCPDWSNPCKHIAAVYYLLAEEFDRDPFLIWKLGGGEPGIIDAADTNPRANRSRSRQLTRRIGRRLRFRARRGVLSRNPRSQLRLSNV